jgi:hypothetical protein
MDDQGTEIDPLACPCGHNCDYNTDENCCDGNCDCEHPSGPVPNLAGIASMWSAVAPAILALGESLNAVEHDLNAAAAEIAKWIHELDQETQARWDGVFAIWVAAVRRREAERLGFGTEPDGHPDRT